ncbi:hypothetical protein LIER_21265 [Lithospermum erythrorhizon]|uniref:Protein ABIL5 n=1 Tax=Lithospermum erythrorhizon TaxID=34254 RepID=A0AAV3QS26_LITER
MQDKESSDTKFPGFDLDEVMVFDKSLKELKDLSSQLHHSAEYCESAFLLAEHKTLVVENTKEYVCKAVVTVVDHLGSISSNLECLLPKGDSISQTEFHINTLRQRLIACQQYSSKLAVSKFYWDSESPKHYQRYILPSTSGSSGSKAMQRSLSIPVSAKSSKVREFEREEEVPLFLYTFYCKTSLIEDLTRETKEEESDGHSAPVLPVCDELYLQPRPQSHFQFQDARKKKRNLLNWKSVQKNELISLIRRGRKTTT